MNMTQDELNFTTRRRIMLVQMMYSCIMNCSNTEEKIISLAKSAAIVSRYKMRLSDGEKNPDIEMLVNLLKHNDDIDICIEKYCDNQPLNRLSKVVLAILRIGAYELKFASQNHKIGNIIKDYLNIAVAFGHNIEAGFIHGVLDKIYKEK